MQIRRERLAWVYNQEDHCLMQSAGLSRARYMLPKTQRLHLPFSHSLSQADTTSGRPAYTPDTIKREKETLHDPESLDTISNTLL